MRENNYFYLPTPYKCAIDRIDNTADRTFAELRQFCDAYAVTYGVNLQSQDHKDYVASTCEIAARRFGETIKPH